MCCQISCNDTRGDLQHETLVGVALRGHPFVDSDIFRKCAEPGRGRPRSAAPTLLLGAIVLSPLALP